MKAPGKYSYLREWFNQSLSTSYNWDEEKTEYSLKTNPFTKGPLPFSLHLSLGTGPYLPPSEVAYCPN